jgi:hypothetical protein
MSILILRSPQPAAAAEPFWLPDLGVGEFIAISGPSPTSGFGLTPTNTAADLDISPIGGGYDGTVHWKAILESWGGAVFVPNLGPLGSLLFNNGGHIDFHWNGWLRFDIFTRTWSIYQDGYTATAWSNNYPTGLFPDGSATPTHNYGLRVFDPNLELVVTGRCESNDNPGLIARVSMFHAIDKTFSHSTVNPAFHGGSEGYGCFDTIRNKIWLAGGDSANNLTLFDAAPDNGDGTRGTYVNFSPGAGENNAIVHDPVNDLLLYAGQNSNALYTFDPNDPDEDYVQRTTSGKPTFHHYEPMVYSTALNKPLYYPGGGEDVYSITKVGNTFAFESITSPSNSVTPAVTSGALCSKFQPARYGAKEVIFMVDLIDGPMYAYRTA